jgi:hypothetical protein
MLVVARWMLSLALALVLGFCVFGFLASGESPTSEGANATRLLYGCVGAFCALAILALWRWPFGKWRG